MNSLLLYGLCLLGFLVSGWLFFSLAAGTVLYLSFLTTSHASLTPSVLDKSDGQRALSAHTKDSRVMDPIREAKDRWFSAGQAADRLPLALTSADGLVLHGELWFARSEKIPENGMLVILVHGFTDSAAGMAYLAEIYHQNGYAVFIPDLRAHGESEGTRITMGKREAEDLGLWINLLKKKFLLAKVILHGVSMGAAAVLVYAGSASENSGLIKLVISDSAYTDYFKTFRRMITLVVKNSILAFGITAAASLVSALMTGVFFSSVKPLRSVLKITVPILFFHGQKDVLVPVEMARTLFREAASGQKDLVVVPDAPHIGAWAYAKDLYWQKIAEMIDKVAIEES